MSATETQLSSIFATRNQGYREQAYDTVVDTFGLCSHADPVAVLRVGQLLHLLSCEQCFLLHRHCMALALHGTCRSLPCMQMGLLCMQEGPTVCAKVVIRGCRRRSVRS